MDMIKAEGLWRQYEGESESVLRGASLTLAKGESVALLGASGAGKSTFLHCVGLLDTPQKGKVLWQGREVQSLSEKERSRLRLEKLGFVFQFHHLIPELTAEENVALPGTLLRGGKPRNARELLAMVGLADKADKHPWQLSGGEQQRVAIARALVNNPEILLTDEATGNLDRPRALEMIDVLLKLSRELGATLLSVTHDEELAGQYSRRLRIAGGLIQ